MAENNIHPAKIFLFLFAPALSCLYKRVKQKVFFPTRVKKIHFLADVAVAAALLQLKKVWLAVVCDADEAR